MYGVGYVRYTFYTRYPVMLVFVLAKRRLMVLDEWMGRGRRRGEGAEDVVFRQEYLARKIIIIKNKIKRRRRRCIGKEKNTHEGDGSVPNGDLMCARARAWTSCLGTGPTTPTLKDSRIIIICLCLLLLLLLFTFSLFIYFFRLPSELGTYYSPV